MKRVLILVLALTTLAVARDKKPKAQPGPYIFTSKASAQVVKSIIVQANLREGYALDPGSKSDSDSNSNSDSNSTPGSSSKDQVQLRFSKPAQMPMMSAIFVASNDCPGMTTKKIWTYTLAETNGGTKVTVQPTWEYPDDYCKTQTQGFIWTQHEEIAAFQALLDKHPASTAQNSRSTPAQASSAIAPASTPKPAADQEQIAKQHTACLELAKDNPSIICK